MCHILLYLIYVLSLYFCQNQTFSYKSFITLCLLIHCTGRGVYSGWKFIYYTKHKITSVSDINTLYKIKIKKTGDFTLFFLFGTNKDSSLTPGLESPLHWQGQREWNGVLLWGNGWLLILEPVNGEGEETNTHF